MSFERQHDGTVRIAFVCDAGYLMQTSVAIHSIRKTISPCIQCEIAVVLPESSKSKHVEEWTKRVSSDDFSVFALYADMTQLEGIHVVDENSICVATPAALLKFLLPDLLAPWDKVIYLDGDIVVKDDITPLWNVDLEGCPIAAVIDSGTIYWKHEYAKKVTSYFNSGVMVMDLQVMREGRYPDALVERKKHLNDSTLMDQNIFNLVFDNKVKLLPIQWNCLFVNLVRAKELFEIDDLNQMYGVDYQDLEEVARHACVIHYSSKDKPWKSQNTPLHGLWYKAYLDADKNGYLFRQYRQVKLPQTQDAPDVSIIIPVYNTAPYLSASVGSIANQSLGNIEIICVDDGSTDESGDILDSLAEGDERIRVFHKTNGGQSSARNLALSHARGRYVYFFDSDDLLEGTALHQLVDIADRDKSDVVFFDGETMYETPELAKKFPQFAGLYLRKGDYPTSSLGESAFVSMTNQNEYLVSPCLLLLSRSFLVDNEISFYEGIAHEDNIFAAETFLRARCVSRCARPLFFRRVREGSTMTSRTTELDYRSFFTCAVKLYALLEDLQQLMPASSDVLRSKAHGFVLRAGQLYRSLDKKDRYQPAFLAEREHLISNLVFDAVSRGSASGAPSKTALQREYKKGMEHVKKSNSWKIGRAVTFAPRLIARWAKRVRSFFS